MKIIHRSKKNYVSITLCCLSIAIISLLNQSCSEEVSQKTNTTALTSNNVASIQTEQEGISGHNLINQAKQIVAKYKLSELPLDCLEFEVLEELFEGKRIIDVREKHKDSCGGDPDTSPRLFSIGVEQSTGAIWSDAKSMLGQLEKLEVE